MPVCIYKTDQRILLDFEVEGFMNTQIIAHAGLMGTRPNSPESIEVGVKTGVQGMEFDLRCSSDGIPFFCHDREVVSPDGQRIYIDSLESAQLKTGQYKSNDSVPPAMEDMLELLSTHPLLLNLDIKDIAALESAFDILRGGWMERCFLTGLSLEEIHVCESLLQEERRTGLMVFLNLTDPESHTGWLDKCFLKQIDGINLPYSLLTDTVVETVRSLCLKIAVWTVDHPGDINKMVTFGCDYITTNRPDLCKINMKLSDA